MVYELFLGVGIAVVYACVLTTIVRIVEYIRSHH